ncbi:MAG: pyridoxamine 5'-phosphate oxidase family protein [Bacteroidales bacterium]|nr:pyridoxamine 5'-phosphate oxidase family protein [Bacteroidales bacterium]
MRRNEKQISSKEELDQIINSADVCRLAMTKDNIPYIVPVSFGYDGESLFVHTAIAGKKIDFLKENDLVCFEFDIDVKTVDHEQIPCKWTAAYKSIIGYGRMIEIENLEERIVAINHIMLHYSAKEWTFNEAMLTKVKLWKIKIDEISGKMSGY